MLRQKYTDSAFNFEAKLRPQFKNMNSCTNPLAPNTTIPHILPFILLRDRTVTDMLNRKDHWNYNRLLLDIFRFILIDENIFHHLLRYESTRPTVIIDNSLHFALGE